VPHSDKASLTAAQVAEAIAAKMGGGIERSAGGFRVRCLVHGGEDRNLSIRDGGKQLLVTCHSHGCDPVAVLRSIRELTGGAAWCPPPRPFRSQEPGRKLEVLALLRPFEGSIAETYWRSRGLALPRPGHALRFLPARPPKYPWPCLVGIITDFADAGRVLSLHFTRLAPDGRGKAPVPKAEQRRFLAGYSTANGVVRLCGDADVTLRLGIAEGIETAAAVTTALEDGSPGGYYEPVWAALSAGNLARLPIVLGIETLVVYADRGPAGEKAAAKLTERWLDASREVFIAVAPVDDWNSAEAS
jgi:Toprim domain-containing protein